MIHKTSLRLGNKVLLGNDIVTVKEIGEFELSFDDGKFLFTYDRFRPIELSPEILEACGFELLNGIVGQYYLKTDRFLFSFYEGKNDIMIQDMKPVNTLAQGIGNLNIEYLHQLQNLVYILTGTELSINLEKVKA